MLIVSDATGPCLVLTGSTNFSVTGLYVNSNHVLVFEDREVAAAYAGVFQEAWDGDVHTAAFKRSEWATKGFDFASRDVPKTRITFSPHDEDFATEILTGMVDRIKKESSVPDGMGSVMFAVMELDGGPENPVYLALNELHADPALFSYGISDNPDGIALYPLRALKGVKVTGKPLNTVLPPPFNQVPSVSELGAGHQVHHKFVVCGFNRPDAVVYCGSSNLALKGEQVNGDNLLAIEDQDVATVFAIEAIALVDHFDFLDRMQDKAAHRGRTAAPALKRDAAVSEGWFLSTGDGWADKFYDPQDLHRVDRELFAG